MSDRVERLRKDGWTVCGTCGGSGKVASSCSDQCDYEIACPDCVDGRVPPDGMVEAAARWAHAGLRRRPLRSWPTLIGAAIYDLHRAIERASDKERQALRAHIDSLTKTNCWWAEYEAAPIVRNALDRFEARLYAEKKLTMDCRACRHAPADHSLLSPYPCSLCDCGGWK